VRELGALAAAAGGIDALVFTGGIGEHADEVRKRVCAQLPWLAVDLPSTNRPTTSGEYRISARRQRRPKCFVIPTNEEWMIARNTLRRCSTCIPEKAGPDSRSDPFSLTGATDALCTASIFASFCPSKLNAEWPDLQAFLFFVHQPPE
jgi:hypothetical protein